MCGSCHWFYIYLYSLSYISLGNTGKVSKNMHQPHTFTKTGLFILIVIPRQHAYVGPTLDLRELVRWHHIVFSVGPPHFAQRPHVGSTNWPYVGSTNWPYVGLTKRPHVGLTNWPYVGLTKRPHQRPHVGSIKLPNVGSIKWPHVRTTWLLLRCTT